MNIIRGSVIGLAGAVGVGVLAWPMSAALAADGDAAYFKRQEYDAQLVAVDDDDDDDTNGADQATNTQATNTQNTNTRSKASRDNTNSRHTAVSRDRDRSRGDLTRDWTRDGGDRTRDWSANQTNDESRNDTRRRS